MLDSHFPDVPFESSAGTNIGLTIKVATPFNNNVAGRVTFTWYIPYTGMRIYHPYGLFVCNNLSPRANATVSSTTVFFNPW